MIISVKDLGADRCYADVFDLQTSIHAQRKKGEVPDTLLLLEHRPVYTMGSSASDDHVLYNAGELAERGIDLVKTSRGGDVTYHGPGQLVAYPIVHLGEMGIKVLDFITGIEEVIIKTAALFGIKAGRDERNRGVWVDNSKLAAMGIRVSRQVTMHGFALNVNTCLSHYSGIIACGLIDAGVTSIKQLTGFSVEMAEVKQNIVENFADVFGYDSVCTSA
ncbi:MAG: lipoyl(octanoyl) transferase LipB [Kiritimatiellia bacterium]